MPLTVSAAPAAVQAQLAVTFASIIDQSVMARQNARPAAKQQQQQDDPAAGRHASNAQLLEVIESLKQMNESLVRQVMRLEPQSDRRCD